MGAVTAQGKGKGKGKQPRTKKRAVEAPSLSSSSSSLSRSTKLSKAKVKKQPKVSEKKKTQVEPQKPICPPSPPMDVPQKRPFPPLSSPSSDNDSGEEGGPERSTLDLCAPKPTQECAQPGDGGVVHQIMGGFLPQPAFASSSSSSDSDSSSDASTSEGEQEVCGQLACLSRHS